MNRYFEASGLMNVESYTQISELSSSRLSSVTNLPSLRLSRARRLLDHIVSVVSYRSSDE